MGAGGGGAEEWSITVGHLYQVLDVEVRDGDTIPKDASKIKEMGYVL